MTKVINPFIGKGKPLKPIELIRYINQESDNTGSTGITPECFETVELISPAKEESDYDVIRCVTSSGTIDMYLGKWNDGVVEGN